MIEWLTDYTSKKSTLDWGSLEVAIFQHCSLWSLNEAGFIKDCLGHEVPRGFELFI